MALKVRVYYHGEQATLDLKKTQTLRELIKLAFETFKIEGKEV